MFLKKLRIVNFRGFGKGENGEGTTIDLNRGLTAFIGRNGSGKTTILEAINYLLGPESQLSNITEKDFNCEANDINDEIIIEGETYNPFYYEVPAITDSRKSVQIVFPCKKIKLTIKRRNESYIDLDVPYDIRKIVTPLMGKIGIELYEHEAFYNNYFLLGDQEYELKNIPYGVSQEINIGRATFIGRDEVDDNILIIRYLSRMVKGEKQEKIGIIYANQLICDLGNLTEPVRVHYLSKERDENVNGQHSLIVKILKNLYWFRKREQENEDRETLQCYYDDLAKKLREFVDVNDFVVDCINNKIREISCEDKEFQIDFMDIEQPYRAAFIAKRENDKLLLPDNLGSGFNILIAYSLFAYIAEKERMPIVFIIDEPELHLHSDWERKMYEMFSNQTNMQIIYSTQSENFVSLKNWRQIKLLKDAQIYPQNEILQSEATSDHGEKASIAKYMDDYAEKNLHISAILRENLEMFFTKKCILVEGPGEKYALPKLLELKGINVDNHSISIIPVWGKTKLKIYQLICKSFGIDYFTLFDRDRTDDGERANENTLIEDNVQEENVFSFSTSFEKKLSIGEGEKFRKLVEKIDKMDNLQSVDAEIIECLDKISRFITDQNNVAV